MLDPDSTNAWGSSTNFLDAGEELAGDGPLCACRIPSLPFSPSARPDRQVAVLVMLP